MKIFPPGNCEKLYRLIDASEVVSFDVFDTILLRKVFQPTDLFTLIERNEKLGFDFKDIRIHAEVKAWNNRKNGILEVGLKEIYDEFSKFPIPGISSKTTEKFREVEINYEKKICDANQFLMKFYKYAVKNKKRIIFCSDMYLPKSVISEILKLRGFRSFEKIYVSCEIQKTKRSGEMFDWVLRDMGVSPSKILHIGDHPISDIRNAARKGFKVFYYKKCSEMAIRDPHFKSLMNSFSELERQEPIVSTWLATIANEFYANRPLKERSFFFRLGFFHAGILLLGFVKWISEQAEKDGVQKIYFLSRDGYLPFEIYKKISRGVKGAIAGDYLYGSRKAFVLPSFTEVDEKSLNFMSQISSGLPLSVYFERLNLKSEYYLEIVRDYGFKSLDQIVENADKIKLKKIFKDIGGDILRENKFERRKLLGYLKQMGVLKLKKIAFVDIGWQGTLQKAYEKLVSNQREIKQSVRGYYFGLRELSEISERNWMQDANGMKGYFTHFGQPNYRKLKYGWPLFELLFYAPHGTVIGFEDKKTKFTPLVDKTISSFNLESSIQVQEGVRNFINSFDGIDSFVKMEIDLISKPIMRLISRPTFEEARNIGKFELGSFGKYHQLKAIAKPPSVIDLFLSPPSFLKGFKESPWKPGYWRQSPFYFLLPSFGIVANFKKKITSIFTIFC